MNSIDQISAVDFIRRGAVRRSSGWTLPAINLTRWHVVMFAASLLGLCAAVFGGPR